MRLDDQEELDVRDQEESGKQFKDAVNAIYGVPDDPEEEDEDEKKAKEKEEEDKK